MPVLPADLRNAVRTFRHRPGFSLLAVLTLAVGMSVNTVAFSVVNALILKRPAYANAERLGWIFVGSRGNPDGDASFPQYEAFRTHAASFDSIAAEGRLPLRSTRAHRVDQIWALVVSGNYFDVLGVRAEAGRLLSQADGDRPVAVVSHQFWVTKLGEAQPGGVKLVLNDVEVPVVGVLPSGFHGPGGIYAPDVWVSLDTRKALGLSPQLESADNGWLTLVGRIRTGATPAQAAAQLTSLVDSEPRTGAGQDRRRVRFVPMKDGHPEVRAIARVAGLGMAVVAIVLLIACFNVAGLFLARATERRREIAVRSALGASGWRLVRQMMTEATSFAGLAGLLALVMAGASGRLLSAFSLPAPIPQQIDLSPDARTVAFTLCMILVATVLPVVFPAWRASRADLRQVLSAEAASTTGGRRCGTRRAFQVLQISGSTMFLALAVLFVGSFRQMLAADLGFDTERVLVVTADPQMHGRSSAQAERFFRSLAYGLRGDPRVRAVASTTGIPYTIGASRATTVGVNGQDCRAEKCQAAQLFVVEPPYLDVMGIKLLQGRNLADADRVPGGAVLVSRTTANKLWPGRSALGQFVTIGPDREAAQVAGIVSDVGASGIGLRPRPHLYRAVRTADFAGTVTMVVGTTGNPTVIADTVRERAASIDHAVPIRSVQSMQDHLRVPMWPARVAAWFLGVCSSIALVLATVGLFGVISYTVAQRSREFGIRMAIGAGARSILALVLKEGAVLTTAGTIIGLAVGVVAAAAVRAALVGVSAGDPRPYLVAAAIQAVVAIAACAYPAVKATRVDPIAVIHDRP